MMKVSMFVSADALMVATEQAIAFATAKKARV
jgi:hypothetical protein